MAIKFLKHRWQKTTAWVTLGVIIIILIAAFIINRYWEPILSKKLKQAVIKGTHGLYQIDFDEIRLHVLQGRVVFYNVNFKHVESEYLRMREIHIAPNVIYDVHAKKLVLKHVHPFQLYFGKELNIGDIIISAPEVNIIKDVDLKRDTSHKNNQTIYQQISKTLKLIHVGNVMFNDVILHYKHDKNGKTAISNLKEINLAATDLLIDSATQFDKSRFLFCRDVTVDMYNYTGSPLSGLYSYRVKALKFSTRTSRLNAYGITLTPTAAPFVFFKKIPKDRFTVRLDSLQLNNFDYNIYSQSNTISASSLDVGYGHLIVFSNPLYNPQKFTVDKIQSFPNEALHQIPTSIKVDTITMHRLAVTYQEYNQKTKRIGRVDFNNIHGKFYNVTNDSAALKKNNICRLNLNAEFMGTAPVELRFIFNLTDKLRSYSYSGTMGEMELSKANPAAVPLASVAIKSGYMQRMDFKFDANRNITRGTVKLLYNDLKVQVLKADTAKEKMHRNLLATLYANAIVISHNNPDHPGDVPRVGHVIFKRPFYYPFFKTLWTALFNGMKPCAGVDAKKQQETNAKMAEHEKKKQEKQHKKELKEQQKQREKLLKQREKQLKKQRNELKKKLKDAEKQKN